MRLLRHMFPIPFSILLGACSNTADQTPESPPQPTATASVVAIATAAPGPSALRKTPAPVELRGFCDASAAVSIAADILIVAGDEDNYLRVYKPAASLEPMHTFDLGPFLALTATDPEADIEAAARVGTTIYWITSHGTSRKGKPRPNRRRLFATDVNVTDGKVTVVPQGKPYTNLVDDFVKSVYLKTYALDVAATTAPKEKNSLNIEGLAATPLGTLLIAFRNPIPDGKALIVPLENPLDVVQGKARAQLGQPILLDLGGLGIRDIEYSEPHHQYFIIAGPYGEEGDFKLYRWSGSSAEDPSVVENVQFSGLQPEALVIYQDDKSQIQVLSDDGTRLLEGVECKDAPAAQRRFRSLWVLP